MLDISFIREHAERVQQAARDKNVDVDVAELLTLDDQRRALRGELDELQRARNEVAGSHKGKPSPEAIAQGKQLKEEAQNKEEALDDVTARWRELLERVPNMPSDDTPVGKDESENVVLREVGEKPAFDFAPKEHWELGATLGVIDTETAADVTGARFAYLKGGLAQLQFALLQYGLSVLTDEEQLQAIADQAGLTVMADPFVPVIVPMMMRAEVMQKMDRLEPRDQRYHLPEDDYYLVGSAEHTLGPMHLGETLTGPRRYVGYSTSFRREAGTYGKDMKGIFRLHQFDKLEIESFTTPEESRVEQEFIVAIQEHLMQSLGLPYQVVLKCTGDMGKPNARALDIETWLPGQDAYRETHTSDLMTDYQARRLGTKITGSDGKKVYAHMNDATVFAVGRTLIAIMENYQQADGTIAVPDVLQSYVSFAAIERV